ncbi:MAG: zinc-ribbon domain-containing protein [Deltaproteobacteria bacterium]|nr:zinc-ribbon domain-containing protein [Deltaproteobacteria bacterium]
MARVFARTAGEKLGAASGAPCTGCGADLPPGAKFCASCGARASA